MQREIGNYQRGIYEFDNDKLASALYCAHYGIIQHYRLFRSKYDIQGYNRMRRNIGIYANVRKTATIRIECI